MVKEISAGIIVFRREKEKIKYLLLQTRFKTEFWGFTKGNVEKGETPEATALREAAEETGLKDIKIMPGFKQKINWFYRREGNLISKEAIYFLGETKTEKVIISEEHLGFAWLDFEESLNKLKFKDDKELLKKANDFLLKAEKQGLKRFIG